MLDTKDSATRQFLRTLIRHSHPQSAREIQCHVAGFRGWDALLDLAREHRVTQIVFASLRNVEREIPANVQERLRAEIESNTLRSLVNATELIALLRAFDRESIEAMPFKGLVLAATIYGDLAARTAGDIDLLVHSRDLRRATTIMVERGYNLTTAVRADGSPTHEHCFEYHFERPADGMVTELRWRLDLADCKFKRELGMHWVWPTRRTAVIAGAEVPNISPVNTLLLLCMHGCKHQWSRLIWLRDVAQLLAVERELNWDLAIREAKRVGLWRPLALGVLLAHKVIGVPVPERILKRFQSDAASRTLTQYFERGVFDAPGVAPTSRVPYYFKLLAWRDRARLLLSPDLLRPNERDFEVLRLPKPFHALYILFRLMRLARDKSPR